jgi:hypothetical protein
MERKNKYNNHQNAPANPQMPTLNPAHTTAQPLANPQTPTLNPARATAQPLANLPKPAKTLSNTAITNPSSSEIHRLTQYLAFQGTMYCKVPALDIIFVMQAG